MIDEHADLRRQVLSLGVHRHDVGLFIDQMRENLDKAAGRQIVADKVCGEACDPHAGQCCTVDRVCAAGLEVAVA